MEKPLPDPSKLLDAWMEWERGEQPPGRVIANLKTGGLRDLLEQVVATQQPAAIAAGTEDAPSAESWTPVV